MDENNKENEDIEIILEPVVPKDQEAAETPQVLEESPLPVPEAAAPQVVEEAPLPVPEVTTPPLAEEPANNVVPTPTPEPVSSDGVEKAKFNFIPLLIIAPIVLLLIGAVVFWLVQGDKIIFQKNIDTLFGRIIFDEKEDKSLKSGALKTEMKLSMEEFIYEVSLDAKIDVVKKLLNLDFAIKDGANDLSGVLYAEDEDVYVSLDKDRSKYYDLHNEQSLFPTDDESFSVKTYNVLVKHLNKAINSNIDELKKDKVKVTVGGKTYDSKKLTLELDEKDLNKIAKDYVNRVKNDKTIKLTESGKEYLNNLEEELKEVSKEKKVIYYHIYMKDFSPLKHEIVLDKEKTLVYETYVNEQKNKTEKFALVYDENQEIFLNVVYKEKENDVLFQFAEGTYLKGTYQKVKDNINAKFTLNLFNEEAAEINLVYTKADISKLNLEIEANTLDAKFSMNSEFDEKVKAVKEEIVESMIEDEFSEEDLNKIMIILTPLMQLTGSF